MKALLLAAIFWSLTSAQYYEDPTCPNNLEKTNFSGNGLNFELSACSQTTWAIDALLGAKKKDCLQTFANLRTYQISGDTQTCTHGYVATGWKWKDTYWQTQMKTNDLLPLVPAFTLTVNCDPRVAGVEVNTVGKAQGNVNGITITTACSVPTQAPDTPVPAEDPACPPELTAFSQGIVDLDFKFNDTAHSSWFFSPCVRKPVGNCSAYSHLMLVDSEGHCYLNFPVMEKSWAWTENLLSVGSYSATFASEVTPFQQTTYRVIVNLKCDFRATPGILEPIDEYLQPNDLIGSLVPKWASSWTMNLRTHCSFTEMPTTAPIPSNGTWWTGAPKETTKSEKSSLNIPGAIAGGVIVFTVAVIAGCAVLYVMSRRATTRKLEESLEG